MYDHIFNLCMHVHAIFFSLYQISHIYCILRIILMI
jgi:hypothetical protein